MLICFFSCYLSLHQTELCRSFLETPNCQFIFISTDPISQERLDMGYEDLDKKYDYVVRAYESDEAQKKAMQLAIDSDIMIFGSAPEKYLKARLKLRKMTFLYSERLYKTGITWKNLPRAMISAFKHQGLLQIYHPYMLCASAYTAGDCAKFGNYLGRCYRWGYFPAVNPQKIPQLMSLKDQNTVPKILWVGRMIDWKHPEAAVRMAYALRKSGCLFQLNLIGNGVMETEIRNLISELNLQDCVSMLGAMPSSEVRKHMEQADIFLSTSDFNEGWGAVLNESMNSGCAEVVSHAIGAAGFLIKNGLNGLLYENGNQVQLEQTVQMLLKDRERCRNLGINAYTTLERTWNAQVAARRFLELSQYLSTHTKGTPFTDGPCSIAPIITNQNSWNKLK